MSATQRAVASRHTVPARQLPYSSSSTMKSVTSRLANRAAQVSRCRAASTSHSSTTGHCMAVPRACTTRSPASALLSATARPRDTAPSAAAKRCARFGTVMSWAKVWNIGPSTPSVIVNVSSMGNS
jgi:hypothetical protein